jgi:arginyl-tRNA synthetase
MTQDIGTAIQRVKDFPEIGGMVYTVGNEQDYHFKVLFLILKNWVLIGLIAYIIYHTEW